MHLRPKTTRRLLILGGVMMALVIAVAAVVTVNNRKKAARIAQARSDAMAAFERDDYAAALPHFSDYLTATKMAERPATEADAEALLAYGKSRQAVPMPRGRHLIEAIRIFEVYLQGRPGDREAQHLLLALYPRVGYNEEALKLANSVLESDPKDTAALRARVVNFINRQRLKEALAATEQLLAILPDDLQGHAFAQSLRMQMARPGEKAGERLVEHYAELQAAHPDDPGFELLLARAYYFAGEHEPARKWLRAAAARNSNDPEVTRVLTGMLEQYSMFAETEQVLERLARDGDPRSMRPLVRRLWQRGDFKEVLKRTDGQDPASPAADTDLLAYRALAYSDLNRPADAAVIVERLAARQNDPSAQAWAMSLRARENENLPPRDRAKQFQEALEQAGDNEVIQFFLGETYAALGESEPAIRAWEEAAKLAPSWAAPAAAIARMLAATGRSGEALDASLEAYRRAPRTVGTTTGYAVAFFAHLQQNPDPKEQQKLLELIERIQTQIPREPETLHIYAAMLARTGKREQASAVIKSALEADPAPPRDTLLALAAVSYAEKLGLEGRILDIAEQRYGVSPAVALRKAVLRSQAGKSREGLALLESARKADAKSDPTRWALAMLQYREMIGDEAVAGDWVKLGDANPDNAMVQAAILRSPSRLGDKAFWLRTIDRLRKLTGDEGLTARIERARWLLAGEPGTKEVSEAVSILRRITDTSLPEVPRLLGLALEKDAARATGSERDALLRAAADELNKAFDGRNADVSVATDLMRVYRAMGRHTDADRVMSSIAERAAGMGVDGRKRAARTLIAQGQLARAIELLEPIGDGQDVTRDALLCELYRRIGQPEKAAALYKRLLADERAEPAMLAEGAEFFATRDDPAERDRFLARLREMDAPPATRELLLARFAERHGSAEEARKGFEAAVAADPAHPAVWQGLVGHHLRRLQFADAIAAADRGLAALPDDANLRSLKARALALQGYSSKDASLQTIAAELSADPQSAAITDMLQILADARKANEPPAKTLPRLRALADRNPDLLRLQMFVAQGHAKLGQFDEAETVAARAAARSPNDPEAARLLTAVYAARPGAEKWPRVLEAARQWRERTLDRPLDADVVIAQTLIEMGRFAEAVLQLKPHVPASPKAADANSTLMGAYTHALLRTGNVKQAAATLQPLAKEDAAWRRLWLRLATLGFDQPQDAIKWIEQVEPLLGTDRAERLALAEAWYGVGLRHSSKQSYENAVRAAMPLTQDANVPLDVWRLVALASGAAGDMEQAVRGYRKLLETNPNNPEVQNNLAYALLELNRPGDLAEAERLAKSASAASPKGSGAYFDTLARVYLKAGNLPAAEQTFGKALDAESGSLEAMIGLADVHARTGQTDKARELLARINDALRGEGEGPSILPDSLQGQLDTVRQSVGEPIQSGRAE